MKIISQVLKNEIKNILKAIFIKKICQISNPFIDNIINCGDNNKLLKLELNYEKNVSTFFIDLIKDAIPIIENYFENSEYRKSNFYISKRNVPRDRELYYGSLQYERNYYCDKNKENGFFFIDELFGFEKFVTYDLLIKALLVDEASRTNANMTSNNILNKNYSILNCLDLTMLNNIPRQTIYSWVKRWKLPKINYEPIESNGTLYVMADEKFIHKQFRKELKKKIKEGLKKYTQEEINSFKEALKKKQYIMSKCFIIFTGAKSKNGRTELLGRHIFVTSNKSPWQALMDEIASIYDFKKINTINLLSDAGSWILSGKSELKLYSNNKITVNTCEFHVKQKIHRMIRDDLYNSLLEADIYEYEDKKDFIKLVDEIIELRPERKDKITEYKEYILKHWKSILNMKYCDIKSSMESHISHYVANHFGSRPKGYSENNIEQYLKIETLHNNGINIFDLFTKSYNNNEYTYNEKELLLSIFDNNSSNLPTCTSKYPISKILNNLSF